MNIEIIKKANIELSKEKPDLSYVRGMLETLISLEEKPERIKSRDELVAEMLDNGSKVTYAIPDPEIPPMPTGMARVLADVDKNRE